MKIYKWSSQALRDYGPGLIVALGNTVAEARFAAMIEFDAHPADPARPSLRADILNDLKMDPVSEGLAVFISGSG